jgi:hypothetical protein
VRIRASVHAVGVLGVLLLLPPARGATSDAISKAIEKGVAYIYSQQKPGGQWEMTDRRIGTEHDWENTQGDSFGGFSALSTYALLAAGESPQDKRVAAGIAFLKKADVIGIYSLGLRAQVWHLLAVSEKDKRDLEKYVTADTERILNGVNTQGDNRGLWDYGNGKGDRVDHSVSQYGILGLWALQEAGAKIDIRYWRIFDEVWRKDQFPDGGWAYNSTPTHKDDQPNPSPSMTAAGIATLFITQDNTFSDIGEHRGNIFNANIENGLSWITNHFGDVQNTYTWYGIERIGVASGTKYFGTTDWFQVGADSLVSSQQPDGHWSTNSPGTDLTNTCFAVLFLSRGRAPVMMNKLHYEIVDKAGKPAETDWNERPRDVANLVQWTGEQIESNLNWQLVNLKVTPEELRDAPILYLSGDQELNLPEAELQKLKTFVNQGGMILGNADNNMPAFAESFQKLGTSLFGYEFRELPANSPILTEQAHLKHSRTKVLALSNGIRELMILLDNGDPAEIWQHPPAIPKPEPFELGANIFLYAVDKKDLESRGETNVVLPNPGIKNNRVIHLARLKYPGNWDPEPGGWTRLAAIFHNDLHADLTVKAIELGNGELTIVPPSPAPAGPSPAEIRKLAFKRLPADQVLATEGDPAKLDVLLQPKIAQIQAELAAQEAARVAALAPYKIAHLTGTSDFRLTGPQIDELRKFIANGGTLIIDSGGGSPQFADSADSLLKNLFPNAGGIEQILPPENPLYTLANEAIPDVAYRTFAHTVMGSLRSGRVIGIPQNGHIAVYFSKEDLSAGLVGQPTDGIVGYTPQTATAIMRNLILIASGGR